MNSELQELAAMQRKLVASARWAHRLTLIALTVVLVLNGSSIAFAQNTKATNDKKDATANSKSSDQTDTQGDDAQQDDKKTTNKEKRGSFVVAPIPISSPAFGSGLLL